MGPQPRPAGVSERVANIHQYNQLKNRTLLLLLPNNRGNQTSEIWNYLPGRGSGILILGLLFSCCNITSHTNTPFTNVKPLKKEQSFALFPNWKPKRKIPGKLSLLCVLGNTHWGFLAFLAVKQLHFSSVYKWRRRGLIWSSACLTRLQSNWLKRCP